MQPPFLALGLVIDRLVPFRAVVGAGQNGDKADKKKARRRVKREGDQLVLPSNQNIASEEYYCFRHR